MKHSLWVILLSLLLLSLKGRCRELYGINITESVLHSKAAEQLAANPVLAHQKETVFTGIGIPVSHQDFGPGFLVCLVLLMAIGLFRQIHPVYFKNIFKAFTNATLSGRQLREHLQQNRVPGMLLDIFFFCSTAFFLIQAAHYAQVARWLRQYDLLLVMTGTALLIAVIFFIRFVLLKMAGWVFQIPDIINAYIFNIALFNRVLGILFVPFSIIITFGSGFWVQMAFVLILLIAVSFYIFRFIRSRQVFEHFLRFSKFHFILYLCASEIIPIAVLIKLITMRIIT
ncbi:MAG TPA: DUF4271 domain-containing protein [Edaphocola sp.]|nr:DUF4271 domain-containing protein [Edaphocola sp.]